MAANLPDAQPQHTAIAGKALRKFAANLPSLGAPAREIDQTPGDIARYAFKFTELESKRIVEAAKRLNLSVTHLFHSAMILASYRLSTPENRERKLTTFSV